MIETGPITGNSHLAIAATARNGDAVRTSVVVAGRSATDQTSADARDVAIGGRTDNIDAVVRPIRQLAKLGGRIEEAEFVSDKCAGNVIGSRRNGDGQGE